MVESSLGSFETAALNLSYSSHSLAPLRSNEHLLSTSNKQAIKNNETKPIFTHKRLVSNPFDIIYDPNARSPRHLASSGDGSSPTTPTFYPKQTPSRNLYTPKNIYTPEHTLLPNHETKRTVYDVPPVITMIDQSALQRSSSIVSRDASLRHRHSITKRNRMINKKSLDIQTPSNDSTSIYASEYKYNTKPKRSVGQKLKFLFQVKRQTSLKQKSTYRLLREMKGKRSNFQTKEELERFLLQSNASQLMKELLPSKMKVFDYNTIGLLTRKPIIQKKSRHFQITGNNNFTIVSPLLDRLKISAPLKNSFVKNPNAGHQGRSVNPDSEFSIVDSIYSRYRHSVLHGNFKIPPKFNDVYPEESHNNLITAMDVENMNKKILLEILLRRTLAAKIEFRLKQNGYYRKTKRRRKTSSNDDESKSDSDSDTKHNVRHSHIPKLVHTDSEDSPDDESLDTDDLMQQNASLFSGLLPSPQISYKSNIFGSDFKLNPELEDSDGDLSSKMVRSEMKLRRTASTNDLLNLVRHVTPTVPTPIGNTFPNSPFNTTNFNVKKVERNESFSARREEELNVLERALGKPQFNYELKPLARSIETFSSSEESGMLSRTPPVELSRNGSLKSFRSNSVVIRRSNSVGNSNKNNPENKRDSHTTDTSGSSFDKQHRKSQSTSNTSIFQDLDDLSSQLSSFIKDPEVNSDPPKFVHKKVVKDDTLLNEGANLSKQSFLETIKLSTTPSEQINISNINESTGILNQGPDIKSVEGSISMAGSETSTSYTHNLLTNLHLNSIRGYNGNKVLKRDDSVSTRTVTTFGRPEHNRT